MAFLQRRAYSVTVGNLPSEQGLKRKYEDAKRSYNLANNRRESSIRTRIETTYADPGPIRRDTTVGNLPSEQGLKLYPHSITDL